MKWDDMAKTLTTGAREGSFPGMLNARTFRVVWVDAKNGTGVEPAAKAREVAYSGQAVVVKK